MSHRNWFLTLVEKHIIPVVWLALFVSVGLTAATYFVPPIYSVKTELCLDASIDKILPDLSGTPSTTAGDYIRQEYFAIHSVNLMQQPAIGQRVILAQGVTDKEGKKISVNNLINPSLPTLLFSNNGKGITIKWISDTQQFSITGYGRDLNSAASLSSAYTAAFLNYDKNQFKIILEGLKKRQNIILKSTTEKRLAVESEQAELRKKYGVADWEERLESLTSSLASTEQGIYAEELAAVTDKQRIEELKKQINELKKTVHLSVGEKKSDVLTSLQSNLAELTQQLAAATIELTPQHPEYKKIKKKIDSVIKQMTKEKKREYSQSNHSTSEALDTVLETLMQTREEQAVRSVKFAELNALKKHYINELNELGNGYSLYNNLEERRSGFTVIIRESMSNIIEIESLLQQPFSFFRVVSEPFVDTDYIDDFKYFPLRKLTLIFSFLGIFFLSVFYILIREMHIETLFYAWQLKERNEDIEAFDLINLSRKRGISFSPIRKIAHTVDDGSACLLRVRSLDGKSNPVTVSKRCAEYFSMGNEPTLLVNNHSKHSDGSTTGGMHAWLTGNLHNLPDGIQKNSKGYDTLFDNSNISNEPWVKGRGEIKELFITFSEYYKNIIIVDPDHLENKRSVSDFLTPDIDILTVNGGTLSVDQVIEAIRYEKQQSHKKRTVVTVMNKKKSINLFSINGLLLLSCRFLKAPIDVLLPRRKSQS